jgi:hypothetical protein
MCSLILVGLAINVAAIPLALGGLDRLYRRQDNSSIEPYSLPGFDNEATARAQAIEIKRQTFLYGPSPLGGRPFFPAGSLGNATVNSDVVQDGAVLLVVGEAVAVDEAKALASIEQVCLRSRGVFRIMS